MRTIIFSSLVFTLAACDGGTDTGLDSGIEEDTGDTDTDTDTDANSLVGEYTTNWDGSFKVTPATITDAGGTGDNAYSNLFAITQWDNDEAYLIAQNDSANAFNPDLWSRFDWTEHNSALYVCQTVFDGATEEAALNATPADATDPATSGCSGFAWTTLTPVP